MNEIASGNNLRLSPNPNNGLLHIQMLNTNAAQEVNLSLFNLQGQVLFTQSLVLGKEGSQMHLPGYLQDGVYFVVLTNSEGRQFTQKLILRLD